MPDISYESFELLESFMKDVFVKVGVPEEDAAICAEVLIESDKRGIDSHGVGRFKPIYIDRINAGLQSAITKIDVIKETKDNNGNRWKQWHGPGNCKKSNADSN